MRELSVNRRKGTDGKISYWYDFVSDIDYEGHKLNCLEYAEDSKPYPFVFLTNLPLSQRNARFTVADAGRLKIRVSTPGRITALRWAICSAGIIRP